MIYLSALPNNQKVNVKNISNVIAQILPYFISFLFQKCRKRDRLPATHATLLWTEKCCQNSKKGHTLLDRPGGPFQSSFVNFSCFSAKSGPLNSMSLKAKVLCCIYFALQILIIITKWNSRLCRPFIQHFCGLHFSRHIHQSYLT